MGLSRGAIYNAFEKNPGDIFKPRERLQPVATEERVSEESPEADSHEEEKLDSNPLNTLIVAGILIGVPLGIFSLWSLGNLAAGKLKM